MRCHNNKILYYFLFLLYHEMHVMSIYYYNVLCEY